MCGAAFLRDHQSWAVAEIPVMNAEFEGGNATKAFPTFLEKGKFFLVRNPCGKGDIL
jgi:hypothetical protein